MMQLCSWTQQPLLCDCRELAQPVAAGEAHPPQHLGDQRHAQLQADMLRLQQQQSPLPPLGGTAAAAGRSGPHGSAGMAVPAAAPGGAAAWRSQPPLPPPPAAGNSADFSTPPLLLPPCASGGMNYAASLPPPWMAPLTAVPLTALAAAKDADTHSEVPGPGRQSRAHSSDAHFVTLPPAAPPAPAEQQPAAPQQQLAPLQ